MVAQAQACGEFMADDGVESVYARGDGAQFRVAKELRRIGVQGPAMQGGYAAVGHPIVAKMLGGQLQARLRPQVDAEGRVHAIALELDTLPIALRILVHRIEPDAGRRAPPGPEVQRGATPLVRAQQQAAARMVLAVGLAGHPVDEATGAAASEDHRVRALQRFSALDVVNVADVLHVIANAIHEEIRSGAVAPEHRRIAVAFALGNADARHVAGQFGHAGDGLVGDQLVGDHGDRLRHVEQGRVGLGGGAGLARGVVRQVTLAEHLHPVKIAGRRGGRFGVGRVSRDGLRGERDAERQDQRTAGLEHGGSYGVHLEPQCMGAASTLPRRGPC